MLDYIISVEFMNCTIEIAYKMFSNVPFLVNSDILKGCCHLSRINTFLSLEK